MKKDKNSNCKIIIEHIFINVLFAANNFDLYLINLTKEINKIKRYYNFTIKSIYLAGDDLLALSTRQLTQLLTLIALFVTENLVEYSCEGAYSQVNEDQLKLLQLYHVNRIVWKVITFQPKLLNFINHKYDIYQMINNIKTSQQCGFNNFSCDLQYNLPHQKTSDLINDVKTALTIDATHISYESYDETQNLESRIIINDMLTKAKYNNYEVFSYSKSVNAQSQQTLAYLAMKNWYGFGPHASSFIKTKKQFITIKNDIDWQTTRKVLTKQDYYQLILVQGLMRKQGIVINSQTQRIITYYQKMITKLIEQKLLIMKENRIMATNQGWLLLNEILTVIINNK